MRALFLSILSLFFAIPALALPHGEMAPSSAPVYLKPNSAVPTGHYSVELLKRTLQSKERMRWVYVKTAQNQAGWVPKHQLLHPLHFSTRARLMVNAPLYKEKSSKPQRAPNNVREETSVPIISVDNEWVQVSYQGEPLWTTLGHLFPIEKDAGYFFSRKDTALTSSPHIKGGVIKKIPAGSRLTPLQTTSGDWAKVAYGNEQGFIRTENIVTRLDIAMKAKTPDGFEVSSRALLGKKIFAIYVNPLWVGTGFQAVNLYQNPYMGAPILGKVSPWQSLLQQDSMQQEWAVSYLKELGGPVWWEMKESGELQQLTKLNLQDVRKVLSNPVFNHLKVASANGLYRSTDGVYWAPLREFSGSNPAFTFSKDGILFAEDKMSVDNGEHFTSFVRWEALLKSLRDNRLAVSKNLRILNIETLNSSSQQIILELDMGLQKPVKAYTADRGQSWSILRM